MCVMKIYNLSLEGRKVRRERGKGGRKKRKARRNKKRQKRKEDSLLLFEFH